MKENKTRQICQGAAVAALYVALTWLSAALGLASGVVQVRLSESLCILPLFLPAAIPGLTVGCLLANLLTGAVVLDVVCGTAATLVGALGTRALRRWPGAALLPPILANMLAVPWVLRYGYGAPDAIWLMALTVGLGELIAVGGLGGLLASALRRRIRI